MFALKPISPESISGALAKAERYRLINEPGEAESICHDILAVDASNEQALIMLVLAQTDQMATDSRAFSNALSTAARLRTPYDRAYYSGIAWERRAKAKKHAGVQGGRHDIHDWVVKALKLFEEASEIREPGNDDAILRWNACVRFLARHKDLVPRGEETVEPIMSE
jgi:hypothetical protein